MEKKLLDAPEPTDPAELEEKVSALVSYYLARSDLVCRVLYVALTLQAAADFNVDLAFSMTQNAFGEVIFEVTLTDEMPVQERMSVFAT
jgi:hypothetical protein